MLIFGPASPPVDRVLRIVRAVIGVAIAVVTIVLSASPAFLPGEAGTFLASVAPVLAVYVTFVLVRKTSWWTVFEVGLVVLNIWLLQQAFLFIDTPFWPISAAVCGVTVVVVPFLVGIDVTPIWRRTTS
ncbi:hypothetical protein [uncultured Amnibacterium sp.]|uniref:hypothetical protein n=1 Tax=uncultured Amnibacterium sp. TaxID=1631851 RepID=UPI0035C9E613